MTAKEHVHYWLCEPPNGEFSEAKCRKCGEVVKFRNSIPIVSAWNSRFSKKNGGKGHGMTKLQLEKAVEKDGRKMPNLPRYLESKKNKEKSDANN